MIEVFKTNLEKTEQSERMLIKIHESFPGYDANFDLEDCDRILRVKCEDGVIASGLIIELMRSEGYFVEILCDEVLEFIP